MVLEVDGGPEGFPVLEGGLYVPQVQAGGRSRSRAADRVRTSGWVDGPFLRGPIPMAWLGRAAALPGKALAVGVALWFVSGLRKGCMDDLKLTTETLKKVHVDRSAKWRALTALEAAGLISVQRVTRKNPLVTILVVGKAAA